MKYALYICFFAIFNSCCKESAEEKFKRECPYLIEYRTNQHQLMIPVTITPNNSKYKLGDTLHIDATFSNLMYDYNTKQKFVIQKFPFDAGVKLWMFKDTNDFQNGFRENEYIMDSIYFQRLDYNGDRTDIIYIDFIENEIGYKFEMKLVLKKKGRYILQFEDFINRYTGEFYDEKILPYTFEGKCPTFGVRPVSMIQGDDHLVEFEPELLHIDKKVFFDNWTTLNKKYFETPYGIGTFFWEFAGTYGFEVE
ncbi:MAG: hypothetical protein IPN29_05420 [Saprospiraceae bacterium]|nr:hypothetical protein [Saprospiraceae bacterium]